MQNSGITPPEAQNLFEVLPGGPSGGFCFAKSGIMKFGQVKKWIKHINHKIFVNKEKPLSLK